MERKKVMIIGASSEVAIQLAILLAKSGSDLILTKRKETEFEPIRKDLMIRYNINVDVLDLDACDFDSHKPILDQYIDSTDDVFCFIGYLGDQKVGEESWEETSRIIDINYKGVVSILNIVANVYEQKKKGNIIGISSVAGDRGRQSNYLYGSAKAALTAYLSGLRNRLYKSKVHVMTVLPGFMRTKMTEHLQLPALLTASPSQAARHIYKCYLRKKNTIYVLPKWRYIMMLIIHIPESVFKRLSL